MASIIADAIAASVSFGSIARLTTTKATAPGLTQGLGESAAPAVRSRGNAVGTLATQAGLHVPGFEQELFGKVLISPQAVDVGFLMDDVNTPIRLWNVQYAREVVLESITSSDTESVFVTGYALPHRLMPGRTSEFTLTVAEVGKPTIADQVALIFDDPGLDTPIPVTGIRVAIVSISPDFEAGITERYAFNTSILKTYGGVEQRAKLRSKPEQSLTYTIAAMDQEEAATLEALLFTSQSRVVGIPHWLEARSAGAMADQAHVPCDTAYTTFAAGGYALLWRSATDFAVVSIKDVDSTGLTLNFPIETSRASGALVVPVSFGRISETVPVDSPTAGVMTAQMTFTLGTE